MWCRICVLEVCQASHCFEVNQLAEDVAAGEGAQKVLYLHSLAQKLQLAPGCIPVSMYNAAALIWVQNPVSAARTKHIDVINHHVRD
jgi:hypothetical protein